MDKAPDAFRTISEVAEHLDVPQHVLRFWESRFREIRPMKRGGGRRYYRPDDIDLLRGIRHLLYGEGYTIRGVQRILREQGMKFVQNVWQPGAPQPVHGPPDEADSETDDMEVPQPAELGEAGRGRRLFGLLPSLLGDEEPEEAPPAHASNRIAGDMPPRLAAGGPVASPMPALSREELRRLQTALHELGECRRLLDAALKDKA